MQQTIKDLKSIENLGRRSVLRRAPLAACLATIVFASISQAFAVQDWPLIGGHASRYRAIELPEVSFDFDLRKGENVAWSTRLGSQTYGSPIVADGRVYVGTNNAAKYRPQHDGDRGVLLCLDEATGEIVWQLTREKLEAGSEVDWPEQGIASNPVVEGNRLWVVTNRCELMCLDTAGFRDGSNDGVYQDEVDRDEMDADIIWSLDMMGELGVHPRNLANCSPVIHDELVFVITSNGVDESMELPSPAAPNFIAVNKLTGKLVWSTSRCEDRVLHGQWASPAVGVVNGRSQVIFPGGDGWVYAFEPETGREIWRFDCNPKSARWDMGSGDRNYIVATPVFFENSVLIGVGQDPEHGEGTGHLWRIDATKSGDISAEIGEIGKPGTPNPNSGAIWMYGGVDVDGSATGDAGEPIFRRTISTVTIANGLVFVPDIAGFFHCVDLQTGRRVWMHDLMTAIWGSATATNNHVFIGTEDGKLIVFKAARDLEIVGEFDTDNYGAIYSTPTIANGHLLLSDRMRLYRIKITQ